MNQLIVEHDEDNGTFSEALSKKQRKRDIKG
jgi:hypothetical protein